MRTDLYRDPKVSVITDVLFSESGELSHHVSQHCQRDMTVTRNVMRNAVVGALVAVWGIARHRGKRIGDDLTMSGCSATVIDDIADVVGFGDAMTSVGWAIEEDGGITFPRFFEEFNSDPKAEAKAKNAERQRRHRQKAACDSNENNCDSNGDSNGDVTRNSNAREEKRREEDKDPPNPPQPGGTDSEPAKGTRPRKPPQHPERIPIPPGLDLPAFLAAWATWLRSRTSAAGKAKVTELAAEMQLKKLAALGSVPAAIDVLEYSTMNSYQGLVFDRKGVSTRPAPKDRVYDTID